MVWAAITAEGASGPNHMSDPATTATKVDGGFLRNRRKTFGTNSAVATHCSTSARYDDPDADDEPG
ncbi:MAG: hypothetical protein L0K86_27410 [Actinomycetia bacterium]|nr:hypothetical protein [Actinomycetes bacterium]